MANKKYRIKLSVEERKELEALIAAGKAAVGKRHRAQILLCADENHQQGAMKDADIARAVGVSVPSVERTRCALAEHGLQVAVHGWCVSTSFASSSSPTPASPWQHIPASQPARITSMKDAACAAPSWPTARWNNGGVCA